jgi:hypothetical protein
MKKQQLTDTDMQQHINSNLMMNMVRIIENTITIAEWFDCENCGGIRPTISFECRRKFPPRKVHPSGKFSLHSISLFKQHPSLPGRTPESKKDVQDGQTHWSSCFRENFVLGKFPSNKLSKIFKEKSLILCLLTFAHTKYCFV